MRKVDGTLFLNIKRKMTKITLHKQNGHQVVLTGSAHDKSDILTTLQWAKNNYHMETYAGVSSGQIDSIRINENEGYLELSDDDLTKILTVLSTLNSLGAKRAKPFANTNKTYVQMEQEFAEFRDKIIPPNHDDVNF